MKIAGSKANAFLLESVEGGAVRGRYSMIGLEPDLLWRCQADKAEINRTPALDPDRYEPLSSPPLTALRELLAESHIDLPENLPPWPPVFLAISAMTWCGRWSICLTSTPMSSAFPMPS